MASWLKEKAPGLHHFLTRKDKPWRMVREVLGFVLAIAVFVALLFGLTGQPLSGGYPVVVVTTGSMMHCEGYFPDSAGPPLGKDCDATSYGRVGSIDPGDLVFVQRVDARDDVTPHASADAGGNYGKDGNVIVFRPHHFLGIDKHATPIIHRALFWVEFHDDGTYSVPELGLAHVTRLDAKGGGMAGCPLAFDNFRHGSAVPSPADSGFITRGDNNGQADQCGETDPVRVETILGVARGELPWIGLVKLFFDDVTGGGSNFGNAGGDSKVMLVVVLVVVLATPWLVDVLVVRKRRARLAAQEKTQGDETEPGDKKP
ncbi:MAG: signal peptidase [Thermoplasmata archaeon]|jgi:signal peptidase|nr:signal peptidase [Thermoplasmata archaeon]